MTVLNFDQKYLFNFDLFSVNSRPNELPLCPAGETRIAMVTPRKTAGTEILSFTNLQEMQKIFDLNQRHPFSTVLFAIALVDANATKVRVDNISDYFA